MLTTVPIVHVLKAVATQYNKTLMSNEKEEVMRERKVIKLALLGVMILFLCTPLHVFAAGVFDGSKPLNCAMMDVIECVPEGGCQEVTPQSVNFPDFLRIDFKKKRITESKEGAIRRTSKIENRELIDGKLILQGAEDGIEGVKDGLGWSIAISQSTGKMVLTGSGDEVGFVVFGACTLQ